MFDPNDNKYSKTRPTEEKILEDVSDYNIFRYYVGEFKIGIPFSSPFRKDDHPSFAIFNWDKTPGRLFFKDHRGPSGDCFTLVKILYNLDRDQCLDLIVKDFNLENKYIINDCNKVKATKKPIKLLETPILNKNPLNLGINVRDWKSYDYSYWASYGISPQTLHLFDVAPIKMYYKYDRVHKADKYAYAYKEYKDNVISYKVYQPFRKSNDDKFINGFVDATISGWRFLPEKGDLLVISKSNKDMMLLYELGYNTIAPQGEGYNFKSKTVDILKSRFNNIVLFYDHDKAGIKSMEKHRAEWNFNLITTLDITNKDISDYFKRYGRKKTKELLKLIL